MRMRVISFTNKAIKLQNIAINIDGQKKIVSEGSILHEKILNGIFKDLLFLQEYREHSCEIEINYFNKYSCYILGFNVLDDELKCVASSSPGITFDVIEINNFLQ